MTSWLWVQTKTTHVRMALVLAYLLDTNKTTGCNPTAVFCVTFGETQTLAAVEPWTETWSLAASGSGCHHCPRRQYRSLKLTQVADLPVGIHIALSGNMATEGKAILKACLKKENKISQKGKIGGQGIQVDAKVKRREKLRL